MSLMLYRQSMRIYKVRSVHVVRVWAYATAGFLPLAVLGYLPAFAIAEYYSSTGNWLRTLKFSWLYDTQPHFALMVLIHGTWSIAQGYRKYLRIPHWLGVAFVSQVMAGLAVIIIVYRFFLR